jgi:uncharacterized protein
MNRIGSRRAIGLSSGVPIYFECQRCTACCRWPGEVHLTEAEISRMAAHKEMSEFDFIQQFTRLSANRQHLVLMDKPNGECALLDGNDCSIQSVKPQQCRDFPNLWNFPGFETICQALPTIVSGEEYGRRLRSATRRHIDSPSQQSLDNPSQPSRILEAS